MKKRSETEMSKTVMLLSTVPDERPEAALKTAADLGYRTIMCAEEPNDQLEAAADAYYVADWSDTEELLRIARKEHIDGAVGLCDPAMIPAAEITEALGLAGNSPASALLALWQKARMSSLQSAPEWTFPSS